MDCWINNIDKAVRIKKKLPLLKEVENHPLRSLCSLSGCHPSVVGYCGTNVCCIVMSSTAETSGFRLNLLFVHSQISPLGSTSVEMTKCFVEQISSGRAISHKGVDGQIALGIMIDPIVSDLAADIMYSLYVFAYKGCE